MKNIFQKKSLILSVIFFIISCIIFVFLYTSTNNNKKISQTTQEKWQTEATQRDNIKFIVRSIKTIAPERDLLETHFVQNSNVVPFLDTIEGLIKKVGFSKSEISSVEVDDAGASLFVEMRVVGSFESIYKLVTLLENSSYSLEFVSVDIRSTKIDGLINQNSKATQQWVADFKVKLLSFIQ